MDGQTVRGRSPSVGHIPNQRIRQSPSPQNFHTPPSDMSHAATNPAFTSQPFNNNLSPTSGPGIQYNNLSPTYLDGPTQQQQYPQHQSHVLPSNDFNSHSFAQSFQQNGVDPTHQLGQSQMNAQQSNQQFQSDMLNLDTEFSGFPQPDFNGKQGQYDNYMIDPQLGAEPSINPADIMSNISSPQNMVPTPPNLMPPSTKASEPTSPFGNQTQQWSPRHSRHTSLDPAQAVYTNGQQTDWAGMLQGQQFQGHRRTPSEHSDVSSASHSPFMAQAEAFNNDDLNPSPSLNSQQDTKSYQEGGLGIENFSLTEQQRNSPRHSPFVSPRMSPQPGLGLAQDNSFMPLPENQHSFGGPGPEIYTNQSEQFPQFPPEQRLGSNDYGQADQYEVPQISVEPAMEPRQPSMEPSRFPQDYDALTPPDRGRKQRMRAKSDTCISRPMTPNSTASTLGSNDSSIAQRTHSLSYYEVTSFSPNGSRESSPAPRSSSQRRSSTSSIPNRDYILELADPSRPAAPGTERRIQKHPATFSCHLCPKKFTRAYNLRSHLRTHTDERPFVCTVCTKAFARQHDRKRHEGLHSGEKKFVCRGELGTGGSWGCGRRFARADALGRHFRSEAGRVCIKPLLDEEAMDRQRLDEQMMNQNMQVGGMAPPAPVNGMGQQQFALPAALLLQYPALQGLQWDQMPQGGPDEEPELSGRSSFDASSGGDFYDEDEGGSGYMSDNPMGSGFSSGGWQHDQGWKSDRGE